MNRPTAICVFLFGSLLIGACSSGPSSSNNQNTGNVNNTDSNKPVSQTETNDDIEELRSQIQIPFEPEEATWRVLPAANNGKRLIAVLRLTPENFRTYSSRLNASGAGRQGQASVEPWFPAELTAMSETTGEMTVPAKSYPANEFFQPPFSSGTVSVIPDTEYVIVELQSN